VPMVVNEAKEVNKVYIQDTKSLGGTFVNNTRLSTSGKESKPFKLRHGDILQFGIDYRSSATSMEGLCCTKYIV